MNRKYWILIFFYLGFNVVSYSQIEDRPQRPTFDYLTIDLNTGHPTLYWTPPPHDPLYPDPIGYIIYRKNMDPLNPNHPIQVDSVLNGNTTFFTDTADGNKRRLIYEIASKGPKRTGIQTLEHSNIFITAVYDSCNHKIDLSWEKDNNYHGWYNRIKKYDVYISNNSNLATFTLLTSLLGNNPHTNILNVIENQNYFVYVEATKDTTGLGGIPYVTKSNLFHIKTTMRKHPATMTIDSIIAEDTKTTLYFKIDPNTGLRNFQIVRWENADSVKSIFTKKILNTFDNPNETVYADEADSWAARTRPFYYKIDALNGCLNVVKTTNHANSITPKVLAEKGMKNRIEWDQLYVDTAIDARKTNEVHYRVIRYAYKTTSESPFFLPETDQLEQIDDVHSLEGDGYSIKFCYQIEAFERNILGQSSMYSRSRIQCVDIIPGVTMPDAIIPTDYSDLNGTGNPRNVLTPTITFKADYALSIYNRWGNLIFYGENKGWNGILSDGQLAKEGSYIYRLVVHTLGNRDVIKEGSFVVIYH